MVDKQDKFMKSKLPSMEELWKITTNMIRKIDGVSLYEIETKCGKLLLVSNEIWYYQSEDIKNSNVKNILNERIRLLIYNRMMLFGLVTLEETYYKKTPYFDIYDYDYDMSFSMSSLKSLEANNPDVYNYIPKNSKKYKKYMRDKGQRKLIKEIIDNEADTDSKKEKLSEAVESLRKYGNEREAEIKKRNEEDYEEIERAIEFEIESEKEKLNPKTEKKEDIDYKKKYKKCNKELKEVEDTHTFKFTIPESWEIKEDLEDEKEEDEISLVEENTRLKAEEKIIREYNQTKENSGGEKESLNEREEVANDFRYSSHEGDSKSPEHKCPKCGSILQEYHVREYRGGDGEFSLICPNCGRVDPSDLIPNKEDKCKDCFAYQFDHKLGYYCTAPVCIKEYNYDPETKSWIPILKNKTKSSELVQIKNEIAKLKEIVLEFPKFMDSLATYFASKYNTEIALTIRTHISRIREQVKLYEK